MANIRDFTQSAIAEILIQESPDAYLALSLDGTVLFWSRGAEAIFGFKAVEALGRRIEDLIVPFDRAEETRQIFARALQLKGKGFAIAKDVRLQRPDGARTAVDLSSTLIEMAGEQAVLSVGRDVTERNRAEGVSEAHQMEATGRLAERIAHDFNNVLAVISNCSEFLVEGMENQDPRRKDALQILDASARAALLVQQLLAFGKKLR